MSPIERLSGLVVGVVESVAPGEVRVLLGPDAPQVTALNTGSPASFPRINGYVLLPNEAGATVGYISWIGVERLPYPKKSGQDFGLVDLPFPLRKMSVSPVGTLTQVRDNSTGKMRFDLVRGVIAFPSVGDQVLLPTAEQVEAIVGAKESDRRVRLGSSPLASNAAIMVDPDKLFGRHLAVLGNTGSGKSCTVAGLIRWSLEAATKAADPAKGKKPNARFVVLDPNGEYARAFSDSPSDVRVFRPSADVHPFVLPAWMWNSHEWAAVTQAQPGVQRPLLLQALRQMRAGRALHEPLHISLVRQVRLFRSRTLAYIADGSGASYTEFVGLINCCQAFRNLTEVMRDFESRLPSGETSVRVGDLAQHAHEFLARHEVWDDRRGRNNYNAPNVAEFNSFLRLFDAVEQSVPAVPDEMSVSEDAPVPFDVGALADHVDAISAESSSNANVANFLATLTLRIRSMLADRRLASIVAPERPPSFQQWLEGLLGGSESTSAPVAVVDLSLVPSDVIHVVVAVLGRLVFEASQRYRKQRSDGMTLPTVIVLEEAHTFIRRGGDDDASSPTSARLCREAFEKIAREGRKFGVGLVLSSQRPSELSATVLAQCNTFMLHRIVNDADQSLVARLVPDNVGGLLKELPSLPSRQAVLLGWAAPIPVLVEVNELPDAQRPHSEDPDFWDVWTLKKERAVDWSGVAREWTEGHEG